MNRSKRALREHAYKLAQAYRIDQAPGATLIQSITRDGTRLSFASEDLYASAYERGYRDAISELRRALAPIDNEFRKAGGPGSWSESQISNAKLRTVQRFLKAFR